MYGYFEKTELNFSIEFFIIFIAIYFLRQIKLRVLNFLIKKHRKLI